MAIWKTGKYNSNEIMSVLNAGYRVLLQANAGRGRSSPMLTLFSLVAFENSLAHFLNTEISYFF